MPTRDPSDLNCSHFANARVAPGGPRAINQAARRSSIKSRLSLVSAHTFDTQSRKNPRAEILDIEGFSKR
jgi:hypothetical protein